MAVPGAGLPMPPVTARAFRRTSGGPFDPPLGTQTPMPLLKRGHAAPDEPPHGVDLVGEELRAEQQAEADDRDDQAVLDGRRPTNVVPQSSPDRPHGQS